MTATATALLGFAGWSLLLVFSIALYRSRIGLSQKKALNSFSATGDDLPPFGMRLTRVHANTYEFLPVAGVVMLYAIATDNTSITDPLAHVFLVARLAQSVIHLSSTSVPAVLLRFVSFAAQVLIVASWIFQMI